jgi:hypothetical protein
MQQALHAPCRLAAGPMQPLPSECHDDAAGLLPAVQGQFVLSKDVQDLQRLAYCTCIGAAACVCVSYCMLGVVACVDVLVLMCKPAYVSSSCKCAAGVCRAG